MIVGTAIVRRAKKMLTRLLLRIILIPVFMLIITVRIALKIVNKLGSYAVTLFWFVLAVAAFFIIKEQQYWQLAIVGISVVVSLLTLTLGVFLEMILEDFENFLRNRA